jgi:DNA-binding LytR/AlgR family response regulator
MSKLKVAILEDSKVLLKDLKQMLDDIDLVEVVAAATTSEDFLTKVGDTTPDALLLDIDLNGDGMNGLDIARKLKLPVLFLTGKMASYFAEMPELDADIGHAPLKYLTKPITTDKLNSVLPKFIHEVRTLMKPATVNLRLKNEEMSRTFELDSVVFLAADKEAGSASGNKEIHFTDRKPGVLVDFSFTSMEEKGFPKEQFLTIHKSFRVNATHVLGMEDDDVLVKAMDVQGRVVEKRLPVSENYRPAIRARYR